MSRPDVEEEGRDDGAGPLAGDLVERASAIGETGSWSERDDGEEGRVL